MHDSCTGKFIVSQNPLAANYLFGQSDAADRLPFVMDEVDPGNVPNFKVHEQSIGRAVMPRSLYLQQLEERLGVQAVERTNDDRIPAWKDESKGFLDRFAYLSEIRVDGKPLPEFDREVLTYEIPVALDHDKLPKIAVQGAEGTSVEQVSLGYCRNTQSRRQYYFDFEISDDGYTWRAVSAPEWQRDNLGRGHIMSMQLMPGVGNSRNDCETFVFPRGIRARLLRIRMYGARFGRGSGTTNANAYWAIDVRAQKNK